MLCLSGWIRSRNQRSRLDQAKIPLAKEAPTLTGTERDAVRPLDVCRQRLSVPQIARQAKIRRSHPQGSLDRRYLLGRQAAGASGSVSFLQPGQPPLLETAHPILNCARGIAQELSDTTAVDPLSDKENPVQTMVIAGFRTSSDLILQTKNHHRGIGNRQGFHALMKSHFAGNRNYLCPRV